MQHRITDSLLAQYFANEASEKEKQLIEEWLLEDPANKILLAEYKHVWKNTRLTNTPSFDKERVYRKISDGVKLEKQISSRLKNKRILRFAASVILFVGLASAWLLFKNMPPAQLTQTAAYGQKIKFTLPDGSLVYLNSGSELRYPEKFSKDNRTVTLTGEAFFEIKRNEQKPFIISTGPIQTRVLGTSFNINAYQDLKQSVSVVSGKVEVKHENHVVILEKHQQVFLKKGKLEKQPVSPSELSWRKGVLIFKDTPMLEVAEKLEKWYNVKIVLQDKALEKCFFTGQFIKEKLPNVLEVLKETFGINYEITKQQVTLKGKGC
ncbi:DUF4974 domain-containing protein [Marivirga sp. S37H4]|uniref:DUF4974 domain-containing protein n=1 Tax=Marivirga aurantiaca TaxID=2802615 RepID=A0A935C8D3_9BACT|nr:FecR domain-containing protein [Marivirga aurantiaca]MBK6265435.1 DUF4974 domain-containing protein [Marivirga aurantiaca]